MASASMAPKQGRRERARKRRGVKRKESQEQSGPSKVRLAVRAPPVVQGLWSVGETPVWEQWPITLTPLAVHSLFFPFLLPSCPHGPSLSSQKTEAQGPLPQRCKSIAGHKHSLAPGSSHMQGGPEGSEAHSCRAGRVGAPVPHFMREETKTQLPCGLVRPSERDTAVLFPTGSIGHS